MFRCGLLMMALLCCSCFSVKPGTVITQGLSGYVYLVSGNQMPSPGRPQSKGRGVSRDIYIYEPTTTAQTEGNAPLFARIKTRLVAQTKSDSTGHYSIKLPAGKYSVFISNDTNFFAAESDGKGLLNLVEIAANKVTPKNFTLNSGAAY